MGFFSNLFGGNKKEIARMYTEFGEEKARLCMEHEKEIEKLKNDQDEKLRKMKSLYAEQLDEVQTAFRKKTASLKEELEGQESDSSDKIEFKYIYGLAEVK